MKIGNALSDNTFPKIVSKKNCKQRVRFHLTSSRSVTTSKQQDRLRPISRTAQDGLVSGENYICFRVNFKNCFSLAGHHGPVG